MRALLVIALLALSGCVATWPPRPQPMSPETRAAIDRAVREMRHATQDTVFHPKK